MPPKKSKTMLKTKKNKAVVSKRRRRTKKVKPLICVYDYFLTHKTRLNRIQKEVILDRKLLFNIPVVKFDNLNRICEPEVIVIEDDTEIITTSETDPEPEPGAEPDQERDPGPILEEPPMNFVVSDVRSYNGEDAEARNQNGTINSIFSAIKYSYPTVPDNNINIEFVWDVTQVNL